MVTRIQSSLDMTCDSPSWRSRDWIKICVHCHRIRGTSSRKVHKPRDRSRGTTPVLCAGSTGSGLGVLCTMWHSSPENTMLNSLVLCNSVTSGLYKYQQLLLKHILQLIILYSLFALSEWLCAKKIINQIPWCPLTFPSVCSVQMALCVLYLYIISAWDLYYFSCSENRQTVWSNTKVKGKTPVINLHCFLCYGISFCLPSEFMVSISVFVLVAIILYLTL